MITAAGSSETPGTDTDNQTIAAHGAGDGGGPQPQAKGSEGAAGLQIPGEAPVGLSPQMAGPTPGGTPEVWERCPHKLPGDADAGLHPGPRTRLGDP